MYRLISTSELELEMRLQPLLLRPPCWVFSSRKSGGSSVLPWQYLFQHPLCGFHLNPTPWPFPLSQSLAPALTLPSILLGTRWPVNFASPLRPGYRPRTLTSEEKRTQDGKLPLITSHAPGGGSSDPNLKVSAVVFSLYFYLWIVSLREHSASLEHWIDHGAKLIAYQTS